MLFSGFLNDPTFADEKKITEAPWKDEKEIKRLTGFGAEQSDLERGYIETMPPKWIPRDVQNYSQRTLDDLDIEGDDRPGFNRIIF